MKRFWHKLIDLTVHHDAGVPSVRAPHGQRASTLLLQRVTVCEPPELAR